MDTEIASVRLFAQPLAVWERDGLAAALTKAKLPSDDIGAEGPSFWRFVTEDDVPVGFGGLEMHGRDALLRSIVILPPVRRRGVGRTIVGLLESEAALRGATALWLLTTATAAFFEQLGYAACDHAQTPQAIRATVEFASLAPACASVMRKSLEQS
jgi:amino-acid N-acetyltransferase